MAIGGLTGKGLAWGSAKIARGGEIARAAWSTRLGRHVGYGAMAGAGYGFINPDYGQSRLGSAMGGAFGGAFLGTGLYTGKMAMYGARNNARALNRYAKLHPNFEMSVGDRMKLIGLGAGASVARAFQANARASRRFFGASLNSNRPAGGIIQAMGLI